MTVIVGYRDENHSLIFSDSIVSKWDNNTEDYVGYRYMVKTTNLDHFSFGGSGDAWCLELAREIANRDRSISFDKFLNEFKAELAKSTEDFEFNMLVVSKDAMIKLEFDEKPNKLTNKYDTVNPTITLIESNVAAIGSGSPIALPVAEALLLKTDTSSVWEVAEALKIAIAKAITHGAYCGGDLNLVIVKGKYNNVKIANLVDRVSL